MLATFLKVEAREQEKGGEGIAVLMSKAFCRPPQLLHGAIN